MPDSKYCYPDSDILINKLNITDAKELFETEKELTAIRLRELQKYPVKGDFDFSHFKAIHKYIFQDIYDWAGEIRTVEIGKGNLFCTTPCIQTYANSVFGKYYTQCNSAKEDFSNFIQALADNYGDLNALHPFREGNGRAQREFARLICLECGYYFSLSYTTHQDMLKASKLSFDKADNSLFINIFSEAVKPYKEQEKLENSILQILTSDDLVTDFPEGYDYYEYSNYKFPDIYDTIYQAKIEKMNAEKDIYNKSS